MLAEAGAARPERGASIVNLLCALRRRERERSLQSYNRGETKRPLARWPLLLSSLQERRGANSLFADVGHRQPARGRGRGEGEQRRRLRWEERREGDARQGGKELCAREGKHDWRSPSGVDGHRESREGRGRERPSRRLRPPPPSTLRSR